MAIDTQITNPITYGQLPPSVVNQAVATAGAPLGAPQFANATSPQQSELARMFNDFTMGQSANNALQLGRQASNQAAQMNTEFQKDRANAGLGLGDLSAGIYGQNNNANRAGLSDFSSLLNFLSAF